MVKGGMVHGSVEGDKGRYADLAPPYTSHIDRLYHLPRVRIIPPICLSILPARRTIDIYRYT